MIRNQLKTAYSRQKSYADNMRKDIEFEEDDNVYWKISPRKGVMRFCKKGKLSPRYVDPYEILQRVSKISYEVRLPSELALIHQVFHVSILKKCTGDLESITPIEGLDVDDNLSYEQVPVETLDRKVKS